jgi:hypothetical protein
MSDRDIDVLAHRLKVATEKCNEYRAQIEEQKEYASALGEVVVTKDREIDDLRAKIDEYAHPLTVRFVPAHIEREISANRKRITELEAELAARTPQWKDAPEWATCAKMDANGAWCWFAGEPKIYMDYWDATVGFEQYVYFDKWQELHMERPKGEA